MHSQRKLLLPFAVTALAVCAVLPAHSQSTASPTAGNGTYIAVDPLANVRYDNRYDISLSMAYAHIKAGPTLIQGANLGGVDLSGSYWLTKRLGVEGSGRAYLGTSGVAPNTQHINGPFISEYMFVGGPELLGPHNKHGAFILHAMVGGAYGKFEQDLRGNPPSVVDFYNDQMALGAVFGGHIDLNRSAHWTFRITPDALLTRYHANYATNTTSMGTFNNWNFGISVGAEYKFKAKRKN
ncbi:MAG: hypothetical protein WCE75_08985 [Terracidiphilus sp.]